MECLTGIKALMESQILAARARDTTVNVGS